MERDRCTTVSRFPGSAARPARATCPNQHKDLRLASMPDARSFLFTIVSEVLVSMRADLTVAVQGQGRAGGTPAMHYI